MGAHTPSDTEPTRTAGRAVEAFGLVKKYGTLTAVDRVAFGVERGEAFGLLGPNGAGKSTVMRMIYCRVPLTDGRLMVEDWDVRQHPREIKSVVGTVPQENNLDPDLNVIDNLRVYARYFRIPEGEAERRAHELLDFVGLGGRSTTEVDHLSGGMKRRLIIARALMNNPRLLILDEPTTGLDPHVRHDLWDRLRELRRRQITIVLSTHYMEEAEKLCDRIVIMDKGQILTSGVPRSLIDEKVSKFVLEIHEADGLQPFAIEGDVVSEAHGSTHYYYAASPELLSPVMNRYPCHKSLLRPANLEDVFFRLTGRDRLE